MKVLYIAMCAPYNSVSHAGGQTLNYYIKEMAKSSNMVVDLVTYCSQDTYCKMKKDLNNVNIHPIVRKYGVKNKIRNILSINSKFNPYYKYCNLMTWNASDLLLKELRKIEAEGYEPDVVIMEWTQISLQIRKIKPIFPYAKYVASEHDVTFLGIERKANLEDKIIKKYYKMIQAKNTYYRELAALSCCDLIVTHNEKDRKLLIEKGINTKKIFTLVPYFHESKIEYNRTNDDILFFGYMKREENITAAKWFIDNVMTKITDLSCKFVIIGGGVDERIRAWETDKIIVTGFVPEIDSYFANAMCFVSPLLLGAGIKVKVLEALYTGIPVLTNKIGIEGIPAKKGRDYLYCETADDYEVEIRKMYGQTKPLINGRKFIESTFSLKDSFNRYYDVLKDLVEKYE